MVEFLFVRIKKKEYNITPIGLYMHTLKPINRYLNALVHEPLYRMH